MFKRKIQLFHEAQRTTRSTAINATHLSLL